MNFRRVGLLVGALLLSACAGNPDAAPATEEPTTTPGSTVPPTAVASTTSTAPPTTKPPKDSRDEDCVVAVEPGGSLTAIVASVDGVTLDELLAENRIGLETVLHPGDELDVCIGNDVDDVTGASLLPPGPRAVRRQQKKLNELFAPYMIGALGVDGDSGPLTRQLLCAARMGLGLPVNATTMLAGSPEEEALLSATTLSIPAGAATWANRWILIDKTCQVVFTGDGSEAIANVYPTSTGEAGYATRNVQALPAFRYDPALENGGWHDSSHFPVAVDNPLNGNMYKPIYFNRGQAIHGANNVPPSPRSKGCARLFTWHHDSLLDWLNLGGITEPTWRRSDIGVTVTAQGSYQPTE